MAVLAGKVGDVRAGTEVSDTLGISMKEPVGPGVLAESGGFRRKLDRMSAETDGSPAPATWGTGRLSHGER